mgnify:CR=1 FL=1
MAWRGRTVSPSTFVEEGIRQQQRVNNARRWSDADKSSKDSIAAVALATSDGVDVLAVGGRGEASLACGARVSLFRDESRLLAAVETHLRNADPDVLFTFDDRRLGLLAQRFRAHHHAQNLAMKKSLLEIRDKMEELIARPSSARESGQDEWHQGADRFIRIWRVRPWSGFPGLQRLEVSTRWSDQGLVLLDLVAVAP